MMVKTQAETLRRMFSHVKSLETESLEDPSPLIGPGQKWEKAGVRRSWGCSKRRRQRCWRPGQLRTHRESSREGSRKSPDQRRKFPNPSELVVQSPGRMSIVASRSRLQVGSSVELLQLLLKENVHLLVPIFHKRYLSGSY